MSLYLTGDTHSRIIERFSYKQNPQYRMLTENDVVIILGDFGGIWEVLDSKRENYQLNWLNQKPWITVVLLGNHENWDKIQAMPQINRFNGVCRQCVYMGNVYEKIFFVDEPTTMDIQGKHILFIPGARSHDIHFLLDPNDSNYKDRVRALKRAGLFYRVMHQSWWPQEAVDINALLNIVDNDFNYYDLILSHEAPADIVNACPEFFNYTIDAAMSCLRFISNLVPYGHWYHGHYHKNYQYSKKITCLYQNTVEILTH